MPPKVKVTKEDIIKTALGLVRKSGESVLNARSIAAELGCSTQPVFSNFTTMEELQQALIVAAYDEYLGFIAREVESGKYPRYKAFGMGYIRFAECEKELFKLLFMRDRRGESWVSTSDFEDSVKMIMEANGVSEETARLMHLEMWTSVHGIGAMLATSFLTLDDEIISRITSDIYHGIRSRHTEEVS